MFYMERLDEEEDELTGGLSMFDKGILGSIWGVSFVYGVLTEQVLGKKVDVPCSISDNISDYFIIGSIILANHHWTCHHHNYSCYNKCHERDQEKCSNSCIS